MTTIVDITPLPAIVANASESKDDGVVAIYQATAMLGKTHNILCVKAKIRNPQPTTKHRPAKVLMPGINRFRLVVGADAIQGIRKALEANETPTPSQHMKELVLSHDSLIPYGSSLPSTNTNKTGSKMPKNTDHFVIPPQVDGEQVFLFWTSYLEVDTTLCDETISDILNDRFTKLKDMSHVIVIMTNAMHRFYTKHIPDFDTNFAAIYITDNTGNFFTSKFLGYNEKGIPIEFCDTFTSNLPFDTEFRLTQGMQMFDFRGSKPGDPKYYEIKTSLENVDGTLYFLVKRTDADTLPVLTLKSGDLIPVTIDTMPNAPALIKAIVDNDMMQGIRMGFTKQGVINEKLMLPALKDFFGDIGTSNYVSMKTILEPFLTQEFTSPETRVLIDHAKMLQGQMYDTILCYISRYQQSIRSTVKPLYPTMALTSAPSVGFIERSFTCQADNDAPPPAMLQPVATLFA